MFLSSSKEKQNKTIVNIGRRIQKYSVMLGVALEIFTNVSYGVTHMV